MKDVFIAQNLIVGLAKEHEMPPNWLKTNQSTGLKYQKSNWEKTMWYIETTVNHFCLTLEAD